MAQISYLVSLPESTLDLATIYIRELAEAVLDSAPSSSSVETRILRTRLDNQDFGSELVLILNTGAFVGLGTAVGHGIANFLRRNSGVKLTIRTDNGEVVVENADSRDVPGIVKAFSKAD